MSKNTKIGLAIVLLAVAGFMTYRSLRTDDVIADKALFACVETGEIFNLDWDDVPAIPAKNPKTGEWTLLPCEKRKDGIYILSRRYAAALQESLKDRNHYVDVGTLEVRPVNGS